MTYISLFMVKLPWLLPLPPVNDFILFFQFKSTFDHTRTHTQISSVDLPVILLVGPLVDEEGDKEGRGYCEERGTDAPQDVWHLRLI